MQYIQVTFSFSGIAEYQRDLLIAGLGDTGFDTFEDTQDGFSAYIGEADFDREALEGVLAEFEGEFGYDYQVTEIEAKNWNEEWEKNFEPLVIDGQCYVRATFHEPHPEYTYEIVIDPKMAFGTGHHQTTTMMMQYILAEELTGAHVLDMGCGTGILAILASKRGAASALAIDYDEVCYQSTIENTALNGTDNVTAACGSKEAIPDRMFDIIFANINRNILLDQIPDYSRVLRPGGKIFFSGFYETPDLEMIRELGEKHGLIYHDHKKNGDWVAAGFVKIDS